MVVAGESGQSHEHSMFIDLRQYVRNMYKTVVSMYTLFVKSLILEDTQLEQMRDMISRTKASFVNI